MEYLLNKYYSFNENSLHFIPLNNTPIIVELHSINYELKITKNKKLTKEYLNSVGANHNIMIQYNNFRKNRDTYYKKTKLASINFWNLYNYNYIYTPLNATDITKNHIRKIKSTKINELMININKYLLNNSKKLLYYYSAALSSYRLYYILHTFKFLTQNEDINSLFLYQLNDLLPIEDYFLYRELKLFNYKLDNIDIVKIIGTESSDIDRTNYLDKLNKVYNFNHYDLRDTFCEQNFITKRKYNFIFSSAVLYNFNYKSNIESINAHLLFSQILVYLKVLKKNGIGIIQIFDTMSNITIDNISIIIKYFKKSYLFKGPLDNILRPYRYLILDGFIGISNEEYNKLEQIKLLWYSSDINCGLKWDTKKFYINGLIKNKSKKLLNQIKIFNLCEIQKRLNMISEINIFYNLIKNISNKDIFEQQFYNLFNNSFNKTKEILSYLQIPIKDININKYIISELIIQPIYYNLIHNSELNNNINISNNNIIDYIIDIIQSNNKLNYIKRSIDTRDKLLWSKITDNIKIYKNIKYKISKELNNNISQAFLKMFEILNIINIIKYNNKTYTSFSLCEAPGQFILAINYYLKTNTNNINYNWYANSLNPSLRPDGFTDTYKLIQKYPEKWLFGSDNTGDITNFNNIIDIKSHLPNHLDLITSDCGIAVEDDKNFNIHEKNMAYLNLSQIRAILYLLSKGGSAIFKIFLPLILPINISLINILYNNFEYIYIYKPQQNPSSSEIYIICKNYKIINKNLLDKLCNITEKTINIYNILIQIDYNFIIYFNKIISSLINNNIYSIERSLYLYDTLSIDKPLLNEFNTFLNKINYKIINNWKQIFKYKTKKINLFKFNNKLKWDT